jgi:YHS domain-containing protein
VQLVEYDRWQPGNKQWGVVHRGRVYLFAGLDEQRRFRANPDHYAPVSSGDDVVLLLEQGRAVEGYRKHGLKFEGHVYLFANEGTLNKFQANPHQYADRALQVIRSNQTASVR